MRSLKPTCAAIAAVAALLGAPGGASALEVYLRAAPTTLELPGPDGFPITVPMWGFAQDPSASEETGAVTVPGPRLAVPAGDTTLVVHLKNRLAVPVSIVVPGLKPVDAGAPSRLLGRAVSLTHQAQPGETATYRFAAKPGTYLYHSGSHVQVQVRMGLYGAVTSEAVGAPGQRLAYPGAAFTDDLLVVLSEVEPALNLAVAAGDFGPGKSVTSTVLAKPTHFLINGKPFSPTDAPVQAGRVGQTTLLRVVNAGIQSHVPAFPAGTLKLVAESGNPLPHPRETWQVHVPALQTADALLQPPGEGPLGLFDRKLGLAGGPGISGGQTMRLAFLPRLDPLRQPAIPTAELMARPASLRGKTLRAQPKIRVFR